MKRNKKQNIKILSCLSACIAALAMSNISISDAKYGTVTKVRFHAKNHSLPAVRNFTLFQLSESTAPCSWLYLPPDDHMITGALMNAKAKDMQVRVEYDPSVGGPWGDAHSCAVVVFEQL
ncbi:MAG: hypothetical protein K6L81_14305 [Agarilytica sp.]